MKEVDPYTIWQTPKYLPYIQPALTDELIQQAEAKIGYKLPKEYIDLLKIQNGGYICFTIKGTPHSQILGIGPYFPSIMSFEWLSEYRDSVSFEVDGLFPFDGDGHWNICLDYRKNKNEPAVTYINTESDCEKSIAKTFKEYINLLEIETNNEFVIETDLTVEGTLNKISSIANIKFESPDYFAHGYPIYRGRYNESWVWVSPNEVPGSFIRETDDRYEELKFQVQSTSLRHPEILASYVFIGVSDETQRQNLINNLIEQGLIINELKTYFDTSPNR